MTTSSIRLTAALLLGLLLLFFLAPALASEPDSLDEAIAAIDEQRYTEAAELLVPLADKGNAGAQNALGILYAQGWGIDQDIDQARGLFEKAAAGGSPRAYYNLAFMYATGNGVEKSCARAVDLLRTPAEAGDPIAQVNIGSLYAEGTECTPQDLDEALHWYRMAAEQDDPVAQHSMGAFYALGEGVEQDFEMARQWYEKAAAQGFADSQAALGWMYFAGEGVEPDRDKACEWLELAAAQGHEVASECLEAIEQGATPDDIDAWVAQYMAAPAKDVAMEFVFLNTLSMMLDMGFNVVMGEFEINDSNREQIRMEIAAKYDAISKAVEIRGFADIEGDYTARATKACSKIHSTWADGTRQGFLGDPTFAQDGHEVTMTQLAQFNGMEPMETAAVIVENVLAFADMMNSDFLFTGVVDDDVIAITPDTDSILAAWPDWVKAPARKDLENCTITLTRK